MSTVIKIENVYKEYRLGVIGYGTLYQDIQSWWAKLRGREDPNSILSLKDTGDMPDKILALKNINLDISHGEVLGIIGKNGAGKSTLLKILSKVTTPTKGSIKIKGKIASLLEVGTGFHPELTGRENIYLNGAIYGVSRKEVSLKLDEIVDFAGIGQFLDTPVKRYSSGMYVRLGFSVAAHLDPDILVVDEVLAVGDADFQKKCIGKMKDVSSQGRTVLFVSHNMASIKQLCSKVILLENGEVSHKGNPNEIINQYLSLENNNVKKSPTIDLRDYKNRKGTGEVYLNRALLRDSDNELRDVFSLGEDLKLIFDLVANSRDRNFTICIHIRSSDGTKLCKIFDHYCDFKVQQITPNTSTISVSFKDIRFYPDKYFISIVLRDYHHDIYDLAEDCLSFEITDGGELTSLHLSKKDGLIYLTPHWEYIKKNS